MTKRGRRSTRNPNPKMKKAILDKRLESLCKKAKGMSILFDIETGLIVFTPRENNVFAWPSLIQAKDRVKDYLSCSKNRRLIQFVNKAEQMAEEKEMEFLFNQLVKARIRVDELDLRETKGLLKLFAVKRAQNEERKKQLKETAENRVGSNDNNDGEENV
ncbi:hypothetical protein H5410_032384 [Solanum commersonii]|uniref:MADS-box domain-containing protein n=2 Tax=Solanum TaxID=4107 RepID=A0A9J5YQ63_SOLCO|nr:hypothetical protein H5410_032384 [Solanum commersonii]